MIVIVMGVSGSGKTTIGMMLASALKWEFRDADLFHSPRNIQKMSQGIALSDLDRQPWLQAMQQAIDQWLQENRNVVLACSALKSSYRHVLYRDRNQMRIVYLKGSFQLIRERLKQRHNHFMNKDLLLSQFDTLEEPEEAIYADASQPPQAIVEQVIANLGI